MKILVTIAWRNLWRNPRRTILTAGTISLGLALLLIFLGMGDGSHRQMTETAIRMGGADVAIQARGYQERAGIDLTLSDDDVRTLSGWISSHDLRSTIQSVSLRVFASGLVSSADGATGARIIGLEPDKERTASLFDDKLIAGQFLPEQGSVAVIGAGVARKLELKTGDKFVLMAQGAGSAEIQSILLRVAGIVRLGLEDFDEATVIIPLSTARQLLRLEGRAHQVAIMLSDLDDSEEVAAELRAALPQRLEILSWDRLMPELRDFIRIDDGGAYVFHALFFAIIAFLVANTLLMSVLERRREFALLDAVGLTPVRRFALVTLEATWIAVLAVGVGTALGYAGHLYFQHYGLPLDLFYSSEVTAGGAVIDPVIYSYLSWRRIAGAAALMFGLTVGLSLLPAWRGATGADAHLLGQI